eukprot:TRINITY_DN4900_c0_g1_i1.p1 TRINITY_DN4900_c0_g1~~TRINITY_DN4900_c0_g1_i1.p1  ORF type:complete len:136 (+),score=17.36 TRINITY_DN4900_c0_g1_i1:282-689(+)
MVLATHLIPKSRNNKKKTKYSEEIRAGELTALKRVIEKHRTTNETVLLMGDFNTQPMEHDIFAGQPKSPCIQDNAALIAFQQQLKEDNAKYYTSRNSVQSEWIDYVWYAPVQLELVGLSGTRVSPNPTSDLKSSL